MKKKTRIIQISGIRGLLLMAAVGICLAAGFVAFPGYTAMHIWNYFASFDYIGNSIPMINLYQGILLWAIIAIVCYMANDKKKYLVSMKNSSELTDEEIKKLMDRIKVQAQAQTINSMILKPDEIKHFENKDSEIQLEDEKCEEEISK